MTIHTTTTSTTATGARRYELPVVRELPQREAAPPAPPDEARALPSQRGLVAASLLCRAPGRG